MWFATVSKVAAVLAIIRVLFQAFLPFHAHISEILYASSIISLMVGALGGLMQKDIKRLIAYSSIGHMGFILMAIAPLEAQYLPAVMIYLLIYTVTILGIFSLLMALASRKGYSGTLSELKGLSHSSPMTALFMGVMIFSMAGIPPLAGFFAKFNAIMVVVKAGKAWVAVIAVACSAVSAYYYLRVIKVMYFEKEAINHATTLSKYKALHYMAALSASFNLLYLFSGCDLSLMSVIFFSDGLNLNLFSSCFI